MTKVQCNTIQQICILWKKIMTTEKYIVMYYDKSFRIHTYVVCKGKIHMKIVKLSKRKLLEKKALVKATKLHTTLERTRNLLRTKKNILATSKILQIRSAAMMGILGPRS